MNEQLLGVLFCFISETQKHMGFNNCLLPLGFMKEWLNLTLCRDLKCCRGAL